MSDRIDIILPHDESLFHLVPSGIHIFDPKDRIPFVEPLNVPFLPPGKVILPENPTIRLCNPVAAKLIHAKQTDLIAAKDAGLYKIERPKLKVIKQSDVLDYADRLTDIAAWLQAVGYKGVIIPLRGGFKPGLQIKIVTNNQPSVAYLPFTGGANGVDRDRITTLLKTYIEGLDPQPPVRLAVLDTANSGHGAKSIAEILLDVVGSSRHIIDLIVDFILIFERRSDGLPYPPLAREIPKMSTDHLIFRVRACETSSLLFEDWDEALGIKTMWKDGKAPELVVIPSSGKLLVEELNGELREIEADRLDQYTDELVASAVNEEIVTDPNLRFHHDVWQDYVASLPAKVDDEQQANLDPAENDSDNAGGSLGSAGK